MIYNVNTKCINKMYLLLIILYITFLIRRLQAFLGETSNNEVKLTLSEGKKDYGSIEEPLYFGWIHVNTLWQKYTFSPCDLKNQSIDLLKSKDKVRFPLHKEFLHKNTQLFMHEILILIFHSCPLVFAKYRLP